MSNYLRHCPKHQKPLPCVHCALAAKPAPAQWTEEIAEPAPVESASHKSKAALRAERWREKRKQKNPDFDQQEAERRKQERDQKKQDPVAWLKRHPEFGNGLDLKKLREQDDHSSTYVTKAPRGKGKVILQGRPNDALVERLDERMADPTAIPGMPTADPFDLVGRVPRRAQLSDAELIDKLKTIEDLQSKIDLIKEHWKHDETFCFWLDNLSLDEIADFMQGLSEDLEHARDLLYEHTEHQARTEVMSWVQPHGKRATPSGITDNNTDELPRQSDYTFTNRISFKKPVTETLRIGGRNARFYYPQNGSAEQHLEKIVRDNVEPQPDRDERGNLIIPDAKDENGEAPNAPMMCNLCQREVAPGFIIGCVISQRFSIQAGIKHFETEHRQEVIDYIRSWEAKAWRPAKRICTKDHAAMAAKYGFGTQTVRCSCGKVIWKPENPTRSDIKKRELVDVVTTAYPIIISMIKGSNHA
jgi:hypothetical protein